MDSSTGELRGALDSVRRISNASLVPVVKASILPAVEIQSATEQTANSDDEEVEERPRSNSGDSSRGSGRSSGSTSGTSGTDKQKDEAEQQVLELLREIRDAAVANGELVKTRRFRLQKYPECVPGNELVDWLLTLRMLGLKERAQAVVVCEMMFEYDMLEHVAQDHPFVDGKLFYRFTTNDGERGKKLSRAALNVYRLMKTELRIGDNVYKGVTYKDTVVATEVVDWLTRLEQPLPMLGRGTGDLRADAVTFCEILRAYGYIRHSVHYKKPFQDKFLFFRLIRPIPGETAARWLSVEQKMVEWNEPQVRRRLGWPVNAARSIDYALLAKTDGHCELGSLVVRPEDVAYRTFPQVKRYVKRLVDDGGSLLVFATPLSGGADDVPPAMLVVETVAQTGMTVSDLMLRMVAFSAAGRDTRVLHLRRQETSVRASLGLKASASGANLKGNVDESVRRRVQERIAEDKSLATLRLDPTPLAGPCAKKVLDEMVRLEELKCRERARIKIGVVFVKYGQTDEDAIFCSTDESPVLRAFMNIMADRVSLAGYTGYAGGLSVETGGESYATTYRDEFSVMFHVLPLLPFDGKSDTQGVGRKRHIGNDVSVIILLEPAPPGQPPPRFDPETLTSHFNHVYCVVSPDSDSSYRVNFGYKHGVTPSLPFLPHPAAFSSNNSSEMRDFLLAKLINAEDAAYDAVGFKKAHQRTNIAALTTAIEACK